MAAPEPYQDSVDRLVEAARHLVKTCKDDECTDRQILYALACLKSAADLFETREAS